MPTISERIVDAVEQLETDAGLHHDIVHGGISAFVATENGPVRSLANAVNTITNTNPRGAWVTATAYALRDVVTSGGIAYLCVVAHTSAAAFATDLAAVRWVVYQGALVSDLTGNSGAENIGFRAPGTGSILRNVGERLKETLSLKDFGCVGNGSADDRANAQLAIDYCAANKIKLTIPTGTFRMTMTGWGGTDTGVYCLQLKSGLHLVGESRNGSILKLANSAYAGGSFHRMFLTESSAIVEGVTLENFTIDGNRSNQTASTNGGNLLFGPIVNGRFKNITTKNANGQGYQLANSLTNLGLNVTIEDVVSQNCSYIGIQCAQFERLSIIDCEVSDCDDNGIDVYGEDGDTSPSSRQFVISRCRVKNCLSGIFLETVKEGVITGNVIDDCTTYGIITNRINGEPSSLRISQNTVTSTPVGLKVSGDSDGVVVSDNDFINFTTAGVVLGNSPTGNCSYAVIKENYFKPASNSVDIVKTEGPQVAFCIVRANTVKCNAFPEAKLYVAGATVHADNQIGEFFCIPFPVSPALVRASANITSLVATTAAIGNMSGTPLFNGMPGLRTGNAANIGPLTYELVMPNIRAGLLFIHAYQNGVGRQTLTYNFIRNGTSLILAANGSPVMGASPLSSATANGAGHVNLVIPYANTYVSWGIIEYKVVES